MNKYLIISIFSLLLVAGNVVTTKELESKVNAIQAPRVGLNSSDINGIKDPFIYLDRNKTTGALMPQNHSTIKDIDLNLSAIMNGKAFVNNNWLKSGDKVGDYTIITIGNNSVVFSKNNSTKRVFINAKKENLIKLQKGYMR